VQIDDIIESMHTIYVKSVPCLFLMMVVDAILILNAIMHWLCFSSIALYSELRVHFMAFLKLSIG
jgi:hypothetical protein